MRQSTWTCFILLGLASLCYTSPIVKRQALDEHPAIEPADQELSEDDANRDKRKIEGAVELKYGAKNAILGLFFNKLNSFLDQKTRWIDQLDHQNIAKNKAYGIESPKDPVSSFGHVFSSPILNGPIRYHGAPAPKPGADGKVAEEDAVEFTPGERVSLQLPDPLFGSGFSLVTNVSKAAGNLIQNSAERTAKLFETMKPFFRSVFGVNSLTITRDVPGIDNKI